MKPTAAHQRSCIDTSSLVNLHQWQPARRHPKPWRRLASLVDDDRLMAPRAVLGELGGRVDVLLTWARGHKAMFKRDTPEIVRRVKSIVRRFPELVDANAAEGNADPFVVALALEESTLHERVIVVTDEKYAPGRPRIPHACQAYDLRYLTVHQLFLFEGWPFDE
ncbi:MAG TPA: DUF4411 family protein [Pirellulales bacterium]|nr:DUF4411 family protein [Pirellulales bacterium]